MAACVAQRQFDCLVQDDLLYESLTVHETLYFAAMLRLPSSMTRAQKASRVADVIQSLGLGRCKDTIIGAAAGWGNKQCVPAWLVVW